MYKYIRYYIIVGHLFLFLMIVSDVNLLSFCMVYFCSSYAILKFLITFSVIRYETTQMVKFRHVYNFNFPETYLIWSRFFWGQPSSIFLRLIARPFFVLYIITTLSKNSTINSVSTETSHAVKVLYTDNKSWYTF